jgi:hypothetical protein
MFLIEVLRLAHTMDNMGTLMRWAKSQGIAVNGVAPQRMPLKGVGMVATKALKVSTPTSMKRP